MINPECKIIFQNVLPVLTFGIINPKGQTNIPERVQVATCEVQEATAGLCAYMSQIAGFRLFFLFFYFFWALFELVSCIFVWGEVGHILCINLPFLAIKLSLFPSKKMYSPSKVKNSNL